MTHNLSVSGMFRSGATLLSRMLSDNSRTQVVADPLTHFFRAYRNFHFEKHGVEDWHPDQPMSDYFLSESEAADEAILASDFSEEMSHERLAKMCSDIRESEADRHPKLCAKLDQLTGGTFAEVYQQLVSIGVATYGDLGNGGVVPFVNRSEEFIPALGRAFPEMQFVCVIRDLRDIVASQNAQQGRGAGKLPLLFHVRHWRKSVAFAKRLSLHDDDLQGRVHVLRYEDLMRDPSGEMKQLTEKVGVPFEDSMLDSECLPALTASRGSGSESSGEENADSPNRWQGELSSAELDAIHSCAGPELASMGYELPQKVNDPINCVDTECEPRVAELAPWVESFRCSAYLTAPSGISVEYTNESLRRGVLESEPQNVPEWLLSRLFFDVKVLEDVRESWNAYLARVPDSSRTATPS